MLQYILNVSIIWLTCLSLYELWLRKESFHQFNRIYLLMSLAAGLILPLINLNQLMPESNLNLMEPAAQVYQIKKAIQVTPIQEAVAPAVSEGSSISTLLWIIYLSGILVGLIILAFETFTLFRLYIKGNKSTYLCCQIVETGKDHGPFSFFNTVFVRSRHDYNNEQWNLLLTHEKEHKRQWHVIDNLLLILLRIICWFHPLPHIYYKRIRVVHEFQADQAAAINTTEYGLFLLEQNLLKGAPVLTHSFNYSPLKTRIMMLTKTRSARVRLLKYLTAFPLLIVLIVFCTQTSFTREIGSNAKKTVFRENVIEFDEFKVIPYEFRETMEKQRKMFLYATLPDSVPVKNFATGHIVMQKVLTDVMPVSLNGKPIFGNESLYYLSGEGDKYSSPVFGATGKNFEEYLFSNLQDELNQLENGYYKLQIDRLVIDDKGQIAYYENKGIQLSMGDDEAKPIIADGIRQRIDQKLQALLEGSPKFKPALQNGKPVNVRMLIGNYEIVLKGHKATLVERMGC